MKYRELLAVLDQDESWTTRSGASVPLTELQPSQCTALLAWLDERARPLMEAWFVPSHIGGDPALGLAIAANRGELPDPMEWLYDQPLVARLVELSTEDERVTS